MMRAAVIGVGAMGRNHARVYSEIPDVELGGVADPDSAWQRRWRDATGLGPTQTMG